MQIYEGTLDEINTRFGRELAGRRLKVIVEEPSNGMHGSVQPLYHTVSVEEWAKALRTWAASHDPNKPALSNEAMDRDSIYEGRGE